VIGIPLLLLVLGLALLYLEHDKGVAILRRSAESLSKGEQSSLPAGRLRRHYRQIAEHLNEALRAGVGFKEDAQQRASVDLDHILNATRESADTGYFGYPAAEAPTAKQVALEEAPQPEPHAPEQMAPIGNQVPSEEPAHANVETARPQRSPSSRPKRASSWPSRALSTRQPAAATIRHTEESLAQAPDDPPTRPNAMLDDYDGFDEPEENTQIKHVPQSLLEASAPGVQGEEAHFREVFDQFVAAQKECGAPVNGLTFDKFVRKLHAARDQVMQRHNASQVRFTVYVKEGRAALKASPVKP
jgi:hypothetical protein